MIQPKLATAFQNIFGVVVTALRSNREPAVTQTELAEFVGVTVSTWSRIERGDSALNLDQMLRVAVFFDTPLSELIRQCENAIGELESKGIEVSLSKNELQVEGSTLSLSNSQLLGLGVAAFIPGPVGIAVSAATAAYLSWKKRDPNQKK
ncbi:helix-turn-helix domain-containing protein [Pseudomonas sp. NA-150]|uniref:helix-turn-helix domain-containing protein n=1 Tax=Pseudomonas sp. NA-150 TaxID=3367525 RepID=UPI0037C69875